MGGFSNVAGERNRISADSTEQKQEKQENTLWGCSGRKFCLDQAVDILAESSPAYLHQALIAYDACVHLCLGAWARGCPEAPEFLQDECASLQECFGLQPLLLQPYADIKTKGVSDDTQATAASKPKWNVGKLKVQGWAAVRKLRFIQPLLNRGNASQRSLANARAYVNAGAQYMRQVSGILKDKDELEEFDRVSKGKYTIGLGQETLGFCIDVEDVVSMSLTVVKSLLEKYSISPQSIGCLEVGSKTTIFLLESPTDELLVGVQDVKGASQGRCVIPLSSMNDDLTDRVCWFSIYVEPEHETLWDITCEGMNTLWNAKYLRKG